MAVAEQKHQQENPLVEGLERVPIHPTTTIVISGSIPRKGFKDNSSPTSGEFTRRF